MTADDELDEESATIHTSPHGVKVYIYTDRPEIRLTIPRPVTDDVRADIEWVKESLKQIAEFSPSIEEQFDEIMNDAWLDDGTQEKNDR